MRRAESRSVFLGNVAYRSFSSLASGSVGYGAFTGEPLPSSLTRLPQDLNIHGFPDRQFSNIVLTAYSCAGNQTGRVTGGLLGILLTDLPKTYAKWIGIRTGCQSVPNKIRNSSTTLNEQPSFVAGIINTMLTNLSYRAKIYKWATV